jgi:2-polyprenyl-3-methyl-5-hydroxy-6-metoxy-1,4-benzoquinol methylase
MNDKKDVFCNLCNSSDYRILFDARDRLHGFEGIFRYVQCTKCGLVYMNPQISPEDAAKFYPADYAPHQNKNANQPTTKRYSKRAILNRPFMPSICNLLNSNAKLLDIGCGNGSFLNDITLLTHCEVYGVDNSALAAKNAKETYGLDIFVGTIEESPFQEKYFDVITAWSFLEHVNNPLEVLRKISNLLKSNGSCIISTPNFDSMNSRIFKDKWYHLDCPRHLYLYNPKTITGLLEKAGLSVEKIKYNGGSKGVLASLQYYFYDNNYNPKYRNRIRRSFLLQKIVRPLTSPLILNKYSDIMTINARKA